MVKVKSVIDISEVLKNSKIKTKNESTKYFPVYVDGDNPRWALFTRHEIDKAMKRATKNPEDIAYLEHHNLENELQYLHDKLEFEEAKVEELRMDNRPWYKKVFGRG